MGHGYWDTATYTSSVVTRSLNSTPTFAYNVQAQATQEVHEALKPERIRTKPLGRLESRDSADHPNSNAVFVCFDVTGSNYQRAVEAQKRLPALLDLLNGINGRRGYLVDPQILIAANDDFHYVGKNCLQISEFESDNRIDEWIRDIWLVGKGGGNQGESYDLVMYAAARKTVTDCWEKRQKKGYFFMYADEPIFEQVSKRHLEAVFGDHLGQSIPIQDMILELRRTWEPYVIWPVGGYANAYEQYVQLFGQQNVLTLQDPNLICELIGSIIGAREGVVGNASALREDLVAAGVRAEDADEVTRYITFDNI